MKSRQRQQGRIYNKKCQYILFYTSIQKTASNCVFLIYKAGLGSLCSLSPHLQPCTLVSHIQLGPIQLFIELYQKLSHWSEQWLSLNKSKKKCFAFWSLGMDQRLTQCICATCWGKLLQATTKGGNPTMSQVAYGLSNPISCLQNRQHLKVLDLLQNLTVIWQGTGGNLGKIGWWQPGVFIPLGAAFSLLLSPLCSLYI